MERATARRPHGIVMDIQLPHISGLDLMANAATRPADPHGAGAGGDRLRRPRRTRTRIRAAGAQGYVSKPIALKPFVAAVTALVV